MGEPACVKYQISRSVLVTVFHSSGMCACQSKWYRSRHSWLISLFLLGSKEIGGKKPFKSVV